MPAGVRTTELWLTIATDVGLIAAAAADALPPKWAAVAAATANAAYALARGLAKTGAPVVVATPTAPTAPPVS
jgi:protein-disulfide isomerase-like protein with CxxC motif